MPEPIRIRAAQQADFPAFARLFPELGTPDPDPDEQAWARIVDASWVLEEDGEVRAYLYGQVLPECGYVRNLVVAPEARGRGYGRRLMTSFADRLRAHGIERWELNVKPDNVPAIALYERLGMRPVYRTDVLRLTWAQAEALPRAPADVAEVPPETDAEVEAALDVPRGLLARGRAEGRHPIALHDPTGHPVGLALFDPDFPGAFPFRVAHPDLAGTLLDGLRPFARHPFLTLTAEGDEALAERLVATGATLMLRVVHYVGAP